jgi:hypothetical protein
VSIERLTAAIDLDMPMLLYDFTDVVAYGAGHSTLEGVFRKAGAAMGVKLSPDPMPSRLSSCAPITTPWPRWAFLP